MKIYIFNRYGTWINCQNSVILHTSIFYTVKIRCKSWKVRWIKKEKMIIGKVGKISMNIWAKLIWDKSRIIHVKCLVAKSHCYHECRIKIKKIQRGMVWACVHVMGKLNRIELPP